MIWKLPMGNTDVRLKPLILKIFVLGWIVSFPNPYAETLNPGPQKGDSSEIGPLKGE